MGLISAELKAAVAVRANEQCEYCQHQSQFSESSFSIDHIIPRSKGGSDDSENLAYCCQGCNNRKYVSVEAVDPVTGRIALLFNPRRDRREDHFQWTADTLQIIGLTATGRATVAKLELNRGNLVRLRELVRRAGLHPPKSDVGTK